jgi:hypothetical protein
MKLSKIDLSKLLAISHDDDHLGLVVDRGDCLEVIEIPAPPAAYAGLLELDGLIAESPFTDGIDLNRLPGVQREVPRLPVQSAMAKAVGYDRDRHQLQVEFKNGSVYEYNGVDSQTWEAFKTSDSAGKFFNQAIKGNYPSRRIE